MGTLLPAIGIGLLALACPLMMVGMGAGAWLIARARGQKKDLSIGCMPMAGHSENVDATAHADGSTVSKEIARLRSEVQALKAQAPSSKQ